MTRPAGLFLLGTYVLALAFLLVDRRPRRAIVAFACPFAAIMLALCTYNRATIGVFTPSAFGEMNVVGAVATFVEEDGSLPSDVNAAAREMRESVTPEDRQLLNTSWNLPKLFVMFYRYFNPAIYKHLASRTGDYLHNRGIYRRMARIAIARHPRSYL